MISLSDSNNVLAIDPGPTMSAYVLIEAGTFKPLQFGKITNIVMLEAAKCPLAKQVVVEKPVSRKWSGSEVSDTAFFAGFLAGVFSRLGDVPVACLTRSKVKGVLGCSRGGDALVREALMGRFGCKGTKKSPGFFYGFRDDIWQAYAAGIAFFDMVKRGGKELEYIAKNTI